MEDNVRTNSSRPMTLLMLKKNPKGFSFLKKKKEP